MLSDFFGWIATNIGRGEQLYRLFRPAPFAFAEYLRRRHNVDIGDNTTVNPAAELLDFERVHIGSNCSVSAVTFVTHFGDDRLLREDYGVDIDSCVDRPIVIEDNVALGYGAIIGPGVTVGAFSIVGFGAVVRQDVPPNSVVIGNPAQVVARRDQHVAKRVARARMRVARLSADERDKALA